MDSHCKMTCHVSIKMDICGVKSTEFAGLRRESGPVVVIGAGMGGLAAAIRLAAAGLPVTLIEAAPEPGGKMRTTPSSAGPVDSGPTVLTLRAVFDDLFAAGGSVLADHLTLIPQDVIARHVWSDGAQLDLHPNADRNEKAIRAFAGERAAAQFRAFNTEAQALRTAFDAPVMQAARPELGGLARAALTSPRLWRVLSRRLGPHLRTHFTDPRLRQLFGRYATYVGGLPARVPAVLGLIWNVEQAGVWAVEGGMARLAGALWALARALGVEVLSSTRVEAILAPDGQVKGVRLPGNLVLGCRAVVFNGDPAALGSGLLGLDVIDALPARAVRPRSLSARVWAFAGRPRGVDLALHTVFFADDETAEFGALAQRRPPVDPTIYVCAQDRAAGAPRGGVERFEMILNAPALPHAPDSSEDPETCRQMTFARLARMGLSFDGLPSTETLTRPQDFARMFPGSDGALYGLSPSGMLASFRRPGARTAIRGLYLAGGGVHPGAGVPMATLSGRHAAAAILNDLGLMSRSGRAAMRGGMSTV